MATLDPSPGRQSTLASSSLPTSADSKGLRDPRKNPIFTIVNDYYAKQQQAYMAKKARQQQQQLQVQENPNLSAVSEQGGVASAGGVGGAFSSLNESAVTNSDYSTDANNSNGEIVVPVAAVQRQDTSTSTQSSRPQQYQHRAATTAGDRLLDWAEMRESAVVLARREANMSLASTLPFQPNLERARREVSPDGSSIIRSSEAAGAGGAGADVSLQSRTTGDLTERLQEQARQSQARLLELRRKRNEELRHECTFAPQTTELAQGVESKVGESTEGLRLRQADSNYRRIEEEEGLDEECTFHPVIGETSRRIFEASYRNDTAEDVYDRLYSKSVGAQMSQIAVMNSSSKPQGTRRTRSGSTTVKSVGSSTSFGPAAGGQKTQATEAKKKLHDLIDEHVFYEISVLRQNFNAEQESPDRSYMDTFLQNVLQEKFGRPVETTFVSATKRKQPGDSQSPQSARKPVLVRRGGAAASSNGAAAEGATTRSFDEFLERQSRAYHDKLLRVEALAKDLAPTYNPQVCQHSLQLVRERPDGFATTQRRSGSLPSRRSNYVDPCTFRPVITKAGEAASPRGLDELYRDAERRRDRINEQLRKKESTAMDGVTFRPQTNTAKNANVESLLTPKNLEQYKEQVERQRLAMEARKKRHEEQSLENEVLECTFRPQTNRTPSYISRMASSFAIVRDSDLSLS